MPCSDDWLWAVASLPQDLSVRFRSSIPAPRVVRAMVDKWEFANLLRSTGTPSPLTRLAQSYVELEKSLDPNFEPLILKPLSSKAFREKHGVKGFVVHTRTDALRIAEHLDFPLMLQEYIPGPATATYHIDGFVDQHEHICALFARQRLRLYPRHLGNSSMMKSVALSQVANAVESLKNLLSAVSYRGIFDAEFKFDHRDGLFKMIEINARPWWYIEFAARCGIDVSWLAYHDALGLAVTTFSQYKTECRGTHVINDVRAYCQRNTDDNLTFWRWVRSLLGADDALFSWDDPAPALATALRGIRKGLEGLGSKVPVVRLQRLASNLPFRKVICANPLSKSSSR